MYLSKDPWCKASMTLFVYKQKNIVEEEYPSSSGQGINMTGMGVTKELVSYMISQATTTGLMDKVSICPCVTSQRAELL